MAKRGQLTPAVKEKMEKFLGRETSVTELRLYPYLTYLMVNEQRVDPAKCNQDDRDVMRLLKDAGYIEGGASGLSMSKEFWDFAQDVLWDTYVAYEEMAS